jgi:cytochrome P450
MSTQRHVDDMLNVTWFNPGDPATVQNPFPAMERLREAGPIVLWQPGVWVTTNYEVQRSILRSKAFVQGDLAASLKHFYGPHFDAMEHPSYRWLSQAFVMQDPPDHTRIRSLVTDALTVRRVVALEPSMRAIADRLLDEVLEAGRMELLGSFAYRLPSLVMAQLLGIGEDECDAQRMATVNDAVNKLVVVFEPRILTATELERADRNIEYLYAFVGELFETRRKHPREDMLTVLVNKPKSEGGLTADELDNIVISFFGAGFETTAHLIGNGVLTLDQHPEQRALLLGRPELAAGAVEEVLRHSSSLNAIYRVASEDVEIEGQHIPKGDRVLLLLSAANRDPSHFPDPTRFDIERKGNKLLTFGYGIHRCVGAELAQLEARVAFQALYRRLPNLRVDQPETKWRNGFFFRGLERLEVAWDKSPS